jgi:hypothetical protein
MVAAIVSLCFEPQQRLFALLLGIPSVVLSLVSHVTTGAISQSALLMGHFAKSSSWFCGSDVKSLFGPAGLSSDSILGATCGCLSWVLGGQIYHDRHIQPGHFQSANRLPVQRIGRPPSDVLTYYSFVTLTTVGYGDVVPATPVTRTCAWIEAISGQFYVAVIVAGLVSMLATRSSIKAKQD